MNSKLTYVFRFLFSLFVIAQLLFPGQQAHATGIKIGLVTDESGIADMGWSYLAYQGLLQAETDLGIIGSLYVPANSSDYGTKFTQCVSDGNELCIGTTGFILADAISAAAVANPGTHFAILDFSPDSPPANLRGVTFNEKQAGYLAGALAGKMTTSHVIGAVGGMPVPAVVGFLDGYRNGAQCIGDYINVLRNYTGSFSDPALGAATAEDLINRGADVIFGAAGATGNGAILYSAQHDVWSIGVDTDQYLSVFENGSVTGSNKLLTSAMKRLDVAVYKTIQADLGGTFDSGTVTYGLAEDGVGLAPFHETDSTIPQSTKDYLTGVKTDIINGTINIDYPCKPRFHAQIVENNVVGMDWWTGMSITLTIDDPGNGPGIDFSDTKIVDASNIVSFDNLGGLTLAPGMLITMSGGTVTKTHTVTNLIVTGVDAAADTVSGTATPGATNINAQYCDNSGCSWRRWVTVESDGSWIADFSVPGGPAPEEQNILDIEPGMRGETLQVDDDTDITDYQWYLPNTRFRAHPTEDIIEGLEWPMGATVTIAINDPGTPANPDYTNSATIGVAPWDPNLTFFSLDFLGLYNLKSGDEVSVTDGITIKTHTMTSLKVTGFYPNTDIISGTAAPGSSVDLWVCGIGGCVYRTELVDPNGDWAANFGVPGNESWEQGTFDIQPDTSGVSLQADSDADNTMVQWGIAPNGFAKATPANGATGVSTSPMLSWNFSSHANSYEYCYSTTNDKTCSNWKSNGAATSVVLTGLSPNTTYYWKVRAINASGVTYANNGAWWSFKTAVQKITKTFYSAGANDGWILESTENSTLGGTLNAIAATLTIGDNNLKKQYRSILSFSTAALPDNAVITKATLKLKHSSITPAGTNPINLLQGIYVDIRKGYFGAGPTLELTDFQAPTSKSVGPFKPVLSSGWYTLSLDNTTFAFINKLNTYQSGLTQFRLRFKLDDNNNTIANMLNLVSGNNITPANRPTLVIEYYIP